MKKPEILSPAGDIECIKAAFAAGADAIYFGLPFFNARQRATNIEPKQLPLIVSEAKLRGIKLYLTLNTLITEEEIPSLLDVIDTAMISGVTDFIIQDMGILYILKKTYPMAKIHISTQATTHTKGQILFLSKCNVERVNLARELSLAEIKELTDIAHKNNMETEVFVHGSLCISFSGQCYLCSFLEGCSGNRGLCQQNCRRLYKKANKKKYFLNLKDNSALEYSSQLMAAGVDSLKIEGRIKGPAYVYSVVKGWKTILENNNQTTAAGEAALLFGGVFNRLFTAGYLESAVSYDMLSEIPADRSLKKIAEVISYSADNFLLESSHMFKSDLLSEIIIKDIHDNFICAAIAEKTVGSNDGRRGEQKKPEKSFFYKIKITGKLEGKIKKGNAIFAQRPALEAGELEKMINSVVFRKIPLTAEIYAEADKEFKLKLFAQKNLSAEESSGTYESEKPISLSIKNSTSKDDISKQLSRFGNTPFELENIVFKNWENNIFIPSSLINIARRKCTAELLGTIDSPRKDIFLAAHCLTGQTLCENTVSASQPGAKPRKLSVFLDNITIAKELKSLYKEKIEIILEINDPTTNTNIDNSFTLFFPAVIEYNAEEKYKQLIKSCNNKIILNNTSFLETILDTGKEWIAGPFLNITNSLAIKLFSETARCSGAIASLELSLEQIKLLAEKSELPLSCFIYSATKLMTTRQCLLEYKCGKKISDSTCYYNCCGEDILDEINGRRLKIYKRKWNFTELYDSSFILIPEIVPALKNKISNFIIDSREFSFAEHDQTKGSASRKTISDLRWTLPEITELFIIYLENPIPDNKNKITELFKATSKGNIKKGI
ncbi:MAG: DUF3656 domain-containing protein [Spirochaetes bacterium]|nr:DUF3656 domain-containing protein [Spirochaetota bacterium]